MHTPVCLTKVGPILAEASLNPLRLDAARVESTGATEKSDAQR